MKNKIRLVWDFRGLDSFKTAEHQLTHLVEFMKQEKIDFLMTKQKKLMTCTHCVQLSLMKII